MIIGGMGASPIVTAVESDKAIKTEGDEVSGATSSPEVFLAISFVTQ